MRVERIIDRPTVKCGPAEFAQSLFCPDATDFAKLPLGFLAVMSILESAMLGDMLLVIGFQPAGSNLSSEAAISVLALTPHPWFPVFPIAQIAGIAKPSET